MWSPTRLASEPTKSNLDRICLLLRELYTFTTGNEYITLGTALQITTDPAGTPVANTLYKGLIPKAWLHYDQTGTPAILDDENISSVTDNATGDFTSNLDRDCSGADAYAAVGFPGDAGAGTTYLYNMAAAPAAGSIQLASVTRAAGTLTDVPDNMLIFMGRQA